MCAERAWVWRFDHPPDAVWAVMADTARFNEAAGFPRHAVEEEVLADGSVLYRARARLGPLTIRWREIPAEWVAGRQFVHRRLFENGPLQTLTASLTLSPEGAGTRADYRLEAEPRGLGGRLLLAAGFFRGVGRTFERLVNDARRHLAGVQEPAFAVPLPKPQPEVLARAHVLAARLEEGPHGHGLAGRLAHHLLERGEMDLRRIRPLGLAREWGVQARDAVELCLEAVRAGLLGMSWDLLCPRCRGAKVTAPSLDRLPEGAHCPSCNVDYGRDFARNVELTFHPAPALRRLEGGEFCLWGPMSTPHVTVQQTLAPGERRVVAADLPPGEWRLRTLHGTAAADVQVGTEGFPAVILGEADVTAGPRAAPGEIVLENRSVREQTAVVESRAWIADALTAHRVTAMQAFRDLFSDQVLRPGDEVGIERIALMFTDLRGSTGLYARIGDAAAYHLVREHFAFLAETVRRHDGAVVKTIGDAVMAAFAEPADALAAALAVQRTVAAFNARLGGQEIVIKLGLHEGPTIAVTLNDRLDYFGSTVNLAARLQGQSRGGDIVLSEGIAADAGALLEGLPLVAEQAPLRGFAEPVRFLRVPPEAFAPPQQALQPRSA